MWRLAVGLILLMTAGAPLPIVAQSPARTPRVGVLSGWSADLPAMYSNQDYMDAGGLMFYGPSVADMYRRSASYVDKILKGQSQ